MSASSIYRWRNESLEPLDYCDMTDSVVEVADSFLVTAGTVLGLGVHRDRFLSSIAPARFEQADPASFFDAALALIPREGDWFPRFELHSTGGAPRLVFRLRAAPDLRRTVNLATWTGDDPRTQPLTKGPDLERLSRVRTAVQEQGADEAVILSPDGYVVEGAFTGLLWWRGDILCSPPGEFERVDSVTARTVLTLAGALGHDTWQEPVTPAELDGTELWAVNALHGIRIATSWVNGPQLAEQPGRLEAWRMRLAALRKPLESAPNQVTA